MGNMIEPSVMGSHFAFVRALLHPSLSRKEPLGKSGIWLCLPYSESVQWTSMGTAGKKKQVILKEMTGQVSLTELKSTLPIPNPCFCLYAFSLLTCSSFTGGLTWDPKKSQHYDTEWVDTSELILISPKISHCGCFSWRNDTLLFPVGLAQSQVEPKCCGTLMREK